MNYEDACCTRLLEVYGNVEKKLNAVGCKLGYYEEDAYLWIEFADGSLEITEKDLLKLNKYASEDALRIELLMMRQSRPKDFRFKNK